MEEPEYRIASYTLSIMQALLEGGLLKFEADGGEFRYISIPGNKDEIYIYSKEPLPEELTKTLNKVGEEIGILYVYVNTRNFSENGDEAAKVVSKALEESLAIKQGTEVRATLSASIIVLTVDTTMDSEEAKDIQERITGVEGVTRVIFIFTDGLRRYQLEDQLETPSEPSTSEPPTKSTIKAEVILEIPKRDTPIGNDDVTNLRILLGEVNTIDDLLNRM